jgi:hypothetical protein
LDVLNLLCHIVLINRWTEAEFVFRRQAVLEKLTQGNSYPRPNGSGNVLQAWSKESGWKVLSWITEQVGGDKSGRAGAEDNQATLTAISQTHNQRADI